MTTESQAAFARRLGVNRSTVHRHVDAGRVVTIGKLIDVEASLARLAQTTGGRPDVSARHAEKRGSAIPTAPAAAPNAPTGAEGFDLDGEAQSGSKSIYKATALEFENKGIKLEMALRRGARHPLAAVKAEAAGIGGTLRSALERLIDQTAPRLAVMASAEERTALIGAEIRAVRRLIRSEFPRALRRIRNHGAKA